MAVLDVLNWLGESLDKPGAAARGLLAGRPDQLANLIPFSDTMGITDPRERVSGRKMLQSWGLTGQNDPDKWFEAGDWAGFGAELATDPLNLLGLGLAGRTARLGRQARVANKAIAAERPGIEAANTASQAMRQAGALPEEKMPNAVKFYDYIDDARKPSFTRGDTATIPGTLGPEGSAGRAVTLDEYRDIVPWENTNWGFPYNRGMRPGDQDLSFWPELFKKSPDDLAEIRRDVDEILGEISPGKRDSLMDPAVALGGDVDYLATILGQPDRLHLASLKSTIDNMRTKYQGAFEDNLERIAAEELGLGAHTPQDLVSEILKNPSDPSYLRTRGIDELKTIGEDLSVASRQAMAPGAAASQSFYALPNPKFIDLELHGALTSDRFPATLLENLENSMFDPGAFQRNMEGAKRILGDELGERLESQLASGRHIPSAIQDPFAEGQTFLPYVAPKIRELPALQDVPRMDRRALAAWLGHNTLAPAGRN